MDRLERLYKMLSECEDEDERLAIKIAIEKELRKTAAKELYAQYIDREDLDFLDGLTKEEREALIAMRARDLRVKLERKYGVEREEGDEKDE